MADWPQPRKGVVLSVGTIPELLNLRAEVLRSAGYEVVSTTLPGQAEFRIANDDYNVLLLCYSIADEWQQRLIQRFRETHPNGRVVAISNVPYARTPEEADEHVYGIEGAEALINAVKGKAA
jgi:DNA-binding response OmpR family regulator